jgi:calcium-dependent protein kinase
LFDSFEPAVNLKKGNFIPFKRKNLLEEYDIKERVGGGAFGTVYRCIHLATKAERTVKVIKKINLLNNRMKVRMEIDIIRKLDHPNVIKMYEAFEYDQTLYLILDYCRGGTLKSCMNDCHLPQHLKK